MSKEKRKTIILGKPNIRGFTSLLLTFCFVVMCVSGVILYMAPKGRVANWSNWTILNLNKEQWSAVHINNCILLVVVAALHLCYNWKVFLSHIRNKALSGLKLRMEFMVAFLIIGISVAGILFNVPPFSSVMALNDHCKTYWASRTSRAPVPHSEELSLKEFAGHVDLSPEEAAEALREEGFVVNTARVTIKELARQKNIAPSEVYEAIKKYFPAAGVVPSRGRGSGRGQRQGLGIGNKRNR